MINTCYATTVNYHTIATYSHLIPVAISLFLIYFVLTKSNYSLLSKVFSWFVFGFSIWLIGDVILWTNNNYHLITAIWAPLDYINVLFFLFAAYFFSVLIKGTDIPIWEKIIFIALSIPAWWIDFSGHSITGFNQPQCEAFNSEWLTNYKLYLEVAVLAYIMFYALFAFIKSDRAKRKQIILVAIALVLFLAIFSATEYISSQTGIYEINLYSLFVLPVFLALIIFSISNLRIFAYKSFGMQILAYILLILVGSQLFFLKDTTDKVLTLITITFSLFLSILLTRNVRREEKMAIDLQISNEGQENLIHIMNHQIKGYLAKGRNIFAELTSEPEYALPPSAKPLVEEGMKSLTEGVDFVQSVLQGSSAAKGTLSYSMKPLDFKTLVTERVEKQKSDAAQKNLKLNIKVEDGKYNINGDTLQLGEAVKNLISNSINYTPSGSVSVNLHSMNGKVLLAVNDTGIGISKEEMPKLFQKGARGKDSLKYNINSTGYGLAFTKGVVEAHKGRVWAESAGVGKGSTFYMELPLSR